MPTNFGLVGSARLNDSGLAEHIRQFSAATDRTIEDVSRQAMKAMVRYVFEVTPPAGKTSKGVAAKRAGEIAIIRDLARAGFTPVTIKGYRMLDHVPAGNVKGRPAVKIDPVRIPTKINPLFADAEAIRTARMKNKHGGRITRGGKRAWYVDKRQFNPMKKRLISHVGKLASGWVLAAQELGVTVPAWVARHGGKAGSEVTSVRRSTVFLLRVINRLPDDVPTDIPEAMDRRLAAIKRYVADGFARQLKAKTAGLWRH